jgi:hypothetical protein
VAPHGFPVDRDAERVGSGQTCSSSAAVEAPLELGGDAVLLLLDLIVVELGLDSIARALRRAGWA